MLSHLSIRHYALIDRLDIDFTDGLNILTGETGSGKSIILGALSLILGERAEKRFVKEGEKKCVVEGIFLLTDEPWKAFFEAHDLDYEKEAILRREITASGKSRGFINDTPVNLKLLKELGMRLVDIHSQHQTIQLNDPDFQIDVIDTFANAEVERNAYRDAYTRFNSTKRRLAELEDQIAKDIRERDFIAFQLEEFEELKLDDVDGDSLEEEFNLLSNSEEIVSKLNQISGLLTEGDLPVSSSLNEAKTLLSDISEYASQYGELHERMNSLIIELDDISREVENEAGEIEIDPQRLSQLEDLQSAIFRLEQKHGVSGVEALLKKKKELSEKLSGSQAMENEVEDIKAELKVLEKKVLSAGKVLSEKRRKAAPTFVAEIESLLGALNMKKASFDVEFRDQTLPAPSGLEVVEMRFSANKGRTPQPLKDVASGGELSRLMLSIKKLSAGRGQTMILDEIDSGVSGEVAHAMGKIMKGMGERQQVIAITHLPQIASKGKSHFKVYKEDRHDEVRTDIRRLSEKERVEEIAQMLSGAKTTKAALDNARDLLEVE